jgi:Zn-dependent protease with chaperone function
MLVLVVLATGFIYIGAIIAALLGTINAFVLLFLLAPVALYFARGRNFAAQRVNGVRMSPTQFPEGHRLVAEAAARFGMATVPDAYVVLGNGRINAFASGHGLRRYVVVYSDLFEIGGEARDPEALAFIIGHEVGHIAAGHTSYWRQLGMFAAPFLPFLGHSLYRAQEYTADNHGFCHRPQGSAGAMATLAAGKYLNRVVGMDEFADRSWQERGFFVWLVNGLATHPVLTWRANALRDRSRHGKLWWRPNPPAGMPPGGYRPPATATQAWPGGG